MRLPREPRPEGILAKPHLSHGYTFFNTTMKQAGGGEGPPTPSPPKGRAGSSSLRDGHQKGGASALSKLASESASATLQLIQQWASQPSGTVQRKAEQSLLKSLMEKNVQLSLDLEREARRIGARQDRRRRTLAQAVAAATEVCNSSPSSDRSRFQLIACSTYVPRPPEVPATLPLSERKSSS